MATVTLVRYEEGAVELQADYHDGNRRVTAVRCINNGSGNLRATLVDPTDQSVAHQVTFLSGTTQINIPQGRTVTIVDGWPEMPYTLRTEYPA